MNIKISGKTPIGVNLTSKERKAMELEIQRQLVVLNEKNAKELCAMVLWVLHENYGFGIKRLKRFYFEFADEVNALAKRYMMDNDRKDKRPWLCTYMLEQIGVNLDEWEKHGREKKL